MQDTRERPRERDWPRIMSVALAALLIGALGFAGAQTARLNAAGAALDAVTQKALYEAGELTEGMAVNLRKLLVAGEAGQRQALLNGVILQSQGALSNLALLPVGQDTVSATLKFINQAGDYAGALSVRLAGGAALEASDEAALRSLSDAAAAFSRDMNALLARYEDGEAVFGGDGDAGGSLYPLTRPAAEYPALLYDGPFSDGRSGGEFRALEGLAPVEEARARAGLAALPGAEDVRFTGQSAIPVDCYEYALRLNGYRLSAGVTRSGGRLLYLLCEDDVAEARLSRPDAVRSGLDFLRDNGFGDMELSYASQYRGILTANFAAVQEGVILYPDLVKLQISLRDGTVIGLEAAGYLTSHVARELPEPALSVEEAEARLGDALAPVSARLCLIPENEAEILCYEITALSGGDTFLAYIDARTGAERTLLQVVSDARGALVM